MESTLQLSNNMRVALDTDVEECNKNFIIIKAKIMSDKSLLHADLVDVIRTLKKLT